MVHPGSDYVVNFARLLEVGTESQVSRLLPPVMKRRLTGCAVYNQFLDIYPDVLAGLHPLVQPTSAGLAAVLPLLAPLARVLEVNSKPPVNGVPWNVGPSVIAFQQLWMTTFERAIDLEIPAELVDVLSILRAATIGGLAGSLGETQATDAVSQGQDSGLSPMEQDGQRSEPTEPHAAQVPPMTRGTRCLIL